MTEGDAATEDATPTETRPRRKKRAARKKATTRRPEAEAAPEAESAPEEAAAPASEAPVEAPNEELQLTYEPESKGTPMRTMIPFAMNEARNTLRENMNRLGTTVDRFVSDELK